jgi:transcriptional regulator with XRE-family HTH domain
MDTKQIIRDAVKARGINQSELARLSGVSQSVISRVMRDKRSMRVETSDKLLAALFPKQPCQ